MPALLCPPLLCPPLPSAERAIKVHGKSCEKGEDYALNANATFGPDVANSHLLNLPATPTPTLSLTRFFCSFPACSSCKLGERIRTFVSAQARPLSRSEARTHTPHAIRMTNMCDTPLAPVVYLQMAAPPLRSAPNPRTLLPFFRSVLHC